MGNRLVRTLAIAVIAGVIISGIVLVAVPDVGAQGLPPPPRGVPTPRLPQVPSTPPLVSLEQAQANVDFKIRMPSSLPDGYEFEGAAAPPGLPRGAGTVPGRPKPPELPPNMAPPPGLPNAGNPPVDPEKIKPPQRVILIFGNAAGELLFLAEAGPSEVPASGIEKRPAGQARVEELTVNRQRAQYLEGSLTHHLRWQGADGIRYDLTSHLLGKTELLRIAESIK